jgi:hypothetical protein
VASSRSGSPTQRATPSNCSRIQSANRLTRASHFD